LGALRTGLLGAVRTGFLGTLRTGLLGVARRPRSGLGKDEELGVSRLTTSLVTGRRASYRNWSAERERTSGLVRWRVS
jgi:hypothetical protein